jgi:hypothetical protein
MTDNLFINVMTSLHDDDIGTVWVYMSDILWLTHVMIQVLLSVYEWYIMTNTCDDTGVVECIWVIYCD